MKKIAMKKRRLKRYNEISQILRKGMKQFKQMSKHKKETELTQDVAMQVPQSL